MTHVFSFLPAWVRALPLAALLAACGGGGVGGIAEVPSEPLVSGTDVPVSATTSSSGAIAFVRSVIGMTSETADPLVLGDAVLATSDTDEPEAP